MLRAIFATGAVMALASTALAQTHVDGYTRRDGTYVAPHYRSGPDNSYNNNWNVQPNVNPYNGNAGARQPTYDNRPPPSNSFGNPYGNQRYR